MSIVLLIKIVQILAVIATIPVVIFIKGRDEQIYQYLQEWHADLMLNVVSTLFMTKLFVIKICGETWTIHTLFEQVVFYAGGVITLFWGAFRIKLLFLEISVKKMEKKLKEKELKS
jgi:hypothetical protein